MLQQGQVFKLRGGDGRDVWAFRYRVGGRGSRRVQRGGFASERDASEALERALEHVRRERGCGSALTLGELVDEYPAQHARGNGSRSSSVTSISRRASSTCAAPTGTGGSSARRPKRAFARCPCRPSRSQHSSSCPPDQEARSCFPRSAAGTSISTTSATANGNPPSAPPRSRRCGASTIYATP